MNLSTSIMDCVPAEGSEIKLNCQYLSPRVTLHNHANLLWCGPLCKTTCVLTEQVRTYNVCTCLWVCLYSIYVLCLFPCTRKIEWITAFQLENPPQPLLHFTLIGIRLWKGILLCALSVFSATVISNYFSWSMTSDNNIFFLHTFDQTLKACYTLYQCCLHVFGVFCV